jgi:putative addiction module killer protein
MITIKIYKTEDGREPFTRWLSGLRDMVTEERISKRIRQIAMGHFGDSKFLGDGVFELRFFFGSGYRVYYGKENDTVVILLCGGDKSTQTKDIETAKIYWQKHRNLFYG